MMYRIFITLSIWVMKLILRFAALRSAEFREQLRDARFSIDIAIGGSTRRYDVCGGRSSDPPDLDIRWKDAGSAGRCLMHLDLAEILQSHTEALSDGRLTVEADLSACNNFGMLLNKLKEAI